MRKVQKVESFNIQNDCETSKNRTDSSSVFTCSLEKNEKVEISNAKIDSKQVKNEQIKRKQTCSLSFVKVFKFQENKFKIVQKNFLEIIIENVSWETHWSQ